MTEKPSRNSKAQPEGYVIACLVQGAWKRALLAIEELGAAAQYAPHLAVVAHRLLAKKALGDARTLADAAVKADPSSAAAHEALAAVLLQTGDVNGAIDAYDRAVRLDRNSFSAHFQLARIRLHQRRPIDALPLIERCIEIAPWDEQVQSITRELRKSCDTILGKNHIAYTETKALAARCYLANSNTKAETLSLCLITKSEAANLPRVIRSVQGLATEVIVVDTGSTDDTLKVAKRLGARTVEFEWVDDFAAARNRSLELATGDWILVMDADDELTPESLPILRRWLKHAQDIDVVGLYRRYPYPGMESDGVSIQPRLFRNGRGIHFEGAIHEQVTRADGTTASPGHILACTIFHHGAIEGADALERRHARNIRILEKTVAVQPDNCLALMYAGLTCYEMQEWEQSIVHFQRLIEIADGAEEYLPKAYACLANALLSQSRGPQAETSVREGLAKFPDNPELWFCLGLVLNKRGRLEEALDAHQRALTGRFGPGLNWHDWACREWKPRLALADLHLSFGSVEAAERQIADAEAITGPLPVYEQVRLAIKQARMDHERKTSKSSAAIVKLRMEFEAGNLESGIALVEQLYENADSDTAEKLSADWLSSQPERPEALAAAGLVAMNKGQFHEAIGLLVSARTERPQLAAAWIYESSAYKAIGRGEDALDALLSAAECPVRSAKTASLIGEELQRAEQWEPSLSSFGRAVELDRHSWRAWLGLGAAQLRTGAIQAAIQSFQQAAALSGGNAELRKALGEASAYLSNKRAA